MLRRTVRRRLRRRVGPQPLSSEGRAFLAEPLGTIVDGITHCETHHEDPADEPQPVPTCGRVDSIAAVYWRTAPRPGGDPNLHYPVAGTAVVEARQRVAGPEPDRSGTVFVYDPVDGTVAPKTRQRPDRLEEWTDGADFQGYIVDLVPRD